MYDGDPLLKIAMPFRSEAIPIVQVGDPVLRQVAAPLTSEQIRSREIQQLIENMRATMHHAPGVGLAAPQIGRSLQIAVIEDKPVYTKESSAEFLRERDRRPVPFHVIINPQLTIVENADVEFFEGCLSLSGFTAVVPRARSVRVTCLDQNAKSQVIEASGWYARILQHEIDHLQGTVYIDRMYPRSFMSVDLFTRHWKEKPIREIGQTLGVEGKLSWRPAAPGS